MRLNDADDSFCTHKESCADELQYALDVKNSLIEKKLNFVYAYISSSQDYCPVLVVMQLVRGGRMLNECVRNYRSVQ